MKFQVTSLLSCARQAVKRRARNPIAVVAGPSEYVAEAESISRRKVSIPFLYSTVGDTRKLPEFSFESSRNLAFSASDRKVIPSLADILNRSFSHSSPLQGRAPPTFLHHARISLSQSDSHPSPLRSLMTSSVCHSSSTSAPPVPRVIPPGGFLDLSSLKDRPGARQNFKRLGRGIGSGKGKTAGRGHKGQKARSGGKPRIGFEGGQTPLRLTLPKRGFHNPFKMEFQVLNLADLRQKIEEGQIDSRQLITMKTLKDAGAIGKAMRDGVKLLAGGSTTWKLPVHIEVSRVSVRAKQAVEAAGGSVVKVHYNKLGLRALYMPEWFVKKGRLLPRAARPPPSILPQVDAIGRLPAPTELPIATQPHAS